MLTLIAALAYFTVVGVIGAKLLARVHEDYTDAKIAAKHGKK